MKREIPVMLAAPAGLEQIVIHDDRTYSRFPVIAMDVANWEFFDASGLTYDSGDETILFTGSCVTTAAGPHFSSLAEFEDLTGLKPSAACSREHALSWLSPMLKDL